MNNFREIFEALPSPSAFAAFGKYKYEGWRTAALQHDPKAIETYSLAYAALNRMTDTGEYEASVAEVTAIASAAVTLQHAEAQRASSQPMARHRKPAPYQDMILCILDKVKTVSPRAAETRNR